MLCGPNRSGSATRSESHFCGLSCSVTQSASRSAGRAFPPPPPPSPTQHPGVWRGRARLSATRQTARLLKPGAHAGRAGPPPLPHLPSLQPARPPAPRQPRPFGGNGKRVGAVRFLFFVLGVIAYHVISWCLMAITPKTQSLLDHNLTNEWLGRRPTLMNADMPQLGQCQTEATTSGTHLKAQCSPQ